MASTQQRHFINNLYYTLQSTNYRQIWQYLTEMNNYFGYTSKLLRRNNMFPGQHFTSPKRGEYNDDISTNSDQLIRTTATQKKKSLYQ